MLKYLAFYVEYFTAIFDVDFFKIVRNITVCKTLRKCFVIHESQLFVSAFIFSSND